MITPIIITAVVATRAQTGRSARRCRGSVMMELLLALPLLFLLLSFLFYFGRGFVRAQHAVGMDRYEAWRRAEHAPGPAAEVAGDNAAMNRVFFGGNAQTIGFESGGGFPPEASDALVEASVALSPEAGDYGEELFAQLPAGSRAAFSTTHAETNDFWQRFAGPIRHSHTRIGNDWRFANGLKEETTEEGEKRWVPTGPNVSNIPVLREVFFTELDDLLKAQADRDVKLAETLRGFYLHQPGYAGPEVPMEWKWGGDPQ